MNPLNRNEWELAQRMPLSRQILSKLDKPRTASELAALLGKKRNQITARLSELACEGAVQRGWAVVVGPWRPVQFWELGRKEPKQ